VRSEVIIFDGHRLNDRFFIGECDIGLPSFEPDYEQKPSGRGSRLTKMGVGTVTITIRLVAKPEDGRYPREALSDLLSWLDVDGERKLSFSSDGGLWRMAVPNGAPHIEDTEWNDVVTVEFLQVDPILYGAERTATIPSGGTAEFFVGGDHPTRPVISASGVSRSSGSLWGLRLDDGEVMHVALPTSTAASVTFDCANRTCRIGSAVALPTYDSDWFELSPGRHEIRMDQGSGAAKVTWAERWHR
jgi:predicted phage tail component-like protein